MNEPPTPEAGAPAPPADTSASPVTFTWGAVTDVGRVRDVNQDSILARDGLFVVADGMGGHSGGEVASAVAVDTMAALPERSRLDELVAQVHRANAAIIDRADADPALLGMGTTVCAVALLAGAPGRLGLVNVGDSRIYLFSDGSLRQVSEDHSLVESLVREGRLAREDAATHPHRNVVVRALGIDPEVLVDYWEIPAPTGRRIVLCSDGLVGEVADVDIAEVLGSTPDPVAAAERLVALANAAGGRDNISVVVVDVDGGADVTPTPGRPRVAALGDPVDGADMPAPAVDGALPRRSVPEEGAPPGAPSGGPTRRRARRHRPGTASLAVRIGLVLVVPALLVVAVVLAGRHARDNYFVTFDGDPAGADEVVDGRTDEPQVAIFRGRPGGFLWWNPTVEAMSGIVEGDLTDALVLELGRSPQFDSLDDARAYIDDLRARAAASTLRE